MSKPGKKRTTTHILRLRGSWRAKHRKDIQAPSDRPICPRRLSKEAKLIWAEEIPKLADMGVISACDRKLLAGMCESLAEFEKYDTQCRDKPFIKTAVGNIVQNPLLSLRNQAWKRYERLAAMFGIGSANRAGMGAVQRPKAGESKTRFFQKGGA